MQWSWRQSDVSGPVARGCGDGYRCFTCRALDYMAPTLRARFERMLESDDELLISLRRLDGLFYDGGNSYGVDGATYSA